MTIGRRNDGFVSFEAEGRTYRLVGDMNALADFEASFNVNVMTLMEGNMADLSVTHLRGLFWAMLLEHQPQITLRDAGKLLKYGMTSLEAAIRMAFPDAPTGAADSGADDAGKPQASQSPH